MANSFTTAIRTGFQVFCVFLAIIFAYRWGRKYYQDEDLPVISYKTFKDLHVKDTPVLSLCLTNPFIDEKLSKHNLNGTQYMEFLQGKYDLEGVDKPQYTDVTYRPEDIVKSYLFKNEYGTYDNYSTPFQESDPLLILNTANGKLISNDFHKCFGFQLNIEANGTMIQYVITFHIENLRQSFNLGKENETSKIDILMFYHSPSRFADSWATLKWIELSNMTNFMFTTMEIVRDRNSRFKKCIDDNVHYDFFLDHLRTMIINCSAPYKHPSNNYETCKTQKQLKDFWKTATIGEGADWKYEYPRPCTKMENIQIRVDKIPIDEIPSNLRGEFSLRVRMPKIYKEIKMIKAINIETMIGTSGGYLGLFCGSSSFD